MRIAWIQPYQNSSPITAYELLLKTASGELILDLVYCDAQSLIIFNQKYCDVPMTVLRQEPYNLAFS